MVCFGAVVVGDPDINFYDQIKPISDKYIPEALAVSGFIREETLKFPDPDTTMARFFNWISKIKRNERVYFIQGKQNMIINLLMMRKVILKLYVI